jgi:hypothetical protein
MGGSCDRFGATVGIKLGKSPRHATWRYASSSQPPRNYLIRGAIGHGGEHLALARREQNPASCRDFSDAGELASSSRSRT